MSKPVPDPALKPRPASAAAAGGGPHAEPDDSEEIYFQGSPPLRALAGMVSLYGLVCVVLLASAGFMIVRHYGPWWIVLGLIVLAGISACIPSFVAKSVRYRVSNYRIDYEHGLLSKNIDTIELWHVEDLHFHQSLFDRILDVGSITVLAHDDALPKLELRGIPDPRPLYETLKQRVIAVKRQRGVIKMDPG